MEGRGCGACFGGETRGLCARASLSMRADSCAMHAGDMLDGISRDGRFPDLRVRLHYWRVGPGGSSCRDIVLMEIIYRFEIVWRLCGRLCGLCEIDRDVRHVDACLSTLSVRYGEWWIVPHAGRN